MNNFIRDQREVAAIVNDLVKNGKAPLLPAIRKSVDVIAGNESLKYRQDLFSVVRRTW